jgi:hypothetical protein
MFHLFPISAIRFDGLTMFGLVAVSLMLLFYGLEDRSTTYVLAFAGACVLGSIYGFLQGAWPFGVVEGIWSLVAIRRWWQEQHKRWKSVLKLHDEREPTMQWTGNANGETDPRVGSKPITPSSTQEYSVSWLTDRI